MHFFEVTNSFFLAGLREGLMCLLGSRDGTLSIYFITQGDLRQFFIGDGTEQVEDLSAVWCNEFAVNVNFVKLFHDEGSFFCCGVIWRLALRRQGLPGGKGMASGLDAV